MFAANTYLIRPATDEDGDTLARLAERSSVESLTGRVLIGQIDGATVAAISLEDDRVVVNPLRATGHLVSCLRIRAQALVAYEATPSLRTRMLAGLYSTNGAHRTTHAGRTPQHQAAAKRTAADRRRRQRRARKGVVAVS